MQTTPYEAVQLQSHDAEEYMSPDAAVHPMVHRADIQGAFQGAETPFDILKFLVLVDDLCWRQSFVGGFQEKFTVDEQFPAAIFLIRITGHPALLVKPELIIAAQLPFFQIVMEMNQGFRMGESLARYVDAGLLVLQASQAPTDILRGHGQFPLSGSLRLPGNFGLIGHDKAAAVKGDFPETFLLLQGVPSLFHCLSCA